MEPMLGQTQEQRQQLTLAPQMRQSLEILQVPMLELRALIQKELEQNPTIEEKAEESEPLGEPAPEDKADEDKEEPDFDAEEFAAIEKADDEWRDYFQQVRSAAPASAEAQARHQFIIDSLTTAVSLQEHLLQQLRTADVPAADRPLGELVIGNINEDGYLLVSPDEMAATAHVDRPRMETVLRQIQEFDPIGVGARDLRECLLIQLTRLGLVDSLAATLVRDHLDLLASRKFLDVARAVHLPVEQVHKAANFVATLQPKPGLSFSSDESPYIVPEIFVTKVEGEYTVITDDHRLPRLHISRHYRRMLLDPDISRATKSYIRDKIRAGIFLMKSIRQRQDTLRRIAREIVRFQREFFEHGISQLKPLTMAEVAGVVGLHETTISRAIANKYVQTPQGVFEMKYFFTPGYRNASGENISNKTVKDIIQQLVAAEPLDKPLSDQALAAEMKKRGMNIARRTIAKYRDELKIQPSHLRRA